MDARYGRGDYRKVMEQGSNVLKETIKCGGLAEKKSKVIISILEFLDERQGGKGVLSLEYVRELDDLAALEVFLRFDGVGVKTATCVLLLGMAREYFAVDTYALPSPDHSTI